MAEFMAEPTIEFSEADTSLLPDYKIEATIRERSEEKPPQCFYLIPPEMALAERPAPKFRNDSCTTIPLPRMLIVASPERHPRNCSMGNKPHPNL